MRPNFLIVGAAKCGTTSLHEYLNQHPDVFIPSKKECLFFSNLGNFHGPDHDQELNRLITRSIEEYEELFAPAGTARALGDVSHDYLYYYAESIRNIKKYLGNDVRIAMILRDPKERAYSHYMHHVKGGISPDSTFENALARERERVEGGWSWNWHYKGVGLYSEQVEAYLGSFAHVRVYLYDDLVTNTEGLMRNLFEFIEVEPDKDVSMQVHNKGYDIRNRALNRFLRRESRAKDRLKALLSGLGFSSHLLSKIKRQALTINISEKMPMNPSTRAQLSDYYANDLDRLQRLIDRDLRSWLV